MTEQIIKEGVENFRGISPVSDDVMAFPRWEKNEELVRDLTDERRMLEAEENRKKVEELTLKSRISKTERQLSAADSEIAVAKLQKKKIKNELIGKTAQLKRKKSELREMLRKTREKRKSKMRKRNGIELGRFHFENAPGSVVSRKVVQDRCLAGGTSQVRP